MTVLNHFNQQPSPTAPRHFEFRGFDHNTRENRNHDKNCPRIRSLRNKISSVVYCFHRMLLIIRWSSCRLEEWPVHFFPSSYLSEFMNLVMMVFVSSCCNRTPRVSFFDTCLILQQTGHNSRRSGRAAGDHPGTEVIAI
jgi:hypothetical protein